MGAIYAKEILGIANPRVGLMNIGSEDGKGNELYRDAHTLLSQSRLKERYIGNVEGRDLYAGGVDVIVCEGFVGNVILKVSEGMADFLFKSVTPEVISRLDTERGLAKRAFEDIGRRFQYSEEGGAPLLGIDGTCIICHGSSDSRSITNALRVATKLKDLNINDQIVTELGETMVSTVG